MALVDGIGIQALLASGRASAARQREIIDRWIENMAAGRVGRPTATAVPAAPARTDA